MRRKLDYYTKGLDIRVRQVLFYMMNNNISLGTVRDFLDTDKGFLSTLSQTDIAKIANNSIKDYTEINKFMIENGRYPLFFINNQNSNIKNMKDCSKEYIDLLKERDEKELEEIMGCSYEDFEPKEYKKKEGQNFEEV